MSGELVARLRDLSLAGDDMLLVVHNGLKEAADRIEELEAEDLEGKLAAAVVSLHRAEKRIERMEAVVAAARLAIDGKTDVVYAIVQVETAIAALDKVPA